MLENAMTPEDTLPNVMITIYGKPKKKKTNDHAEPEIEDGEYSD